MIDLPPIASRIESYYKDLTSGVEVDLSLAKPDVDEALKGIEDGRYRVAEKRSSSWEVNIWVKKAILLSFRLQQNEPSNIGALKFYDKISVKQELPPGTRVVPGGTAIRSGSFVASGVIVMPPSYINIGAFVGANSMIDSHVLVGSGAQIGEGVHLGAGVKIGGILEPPQAKPVIIEDNAFVGLNCGIAEGTFIGEGAVIGAGTTITAHTPIIDIESGEKLFAEVPPYSLVIPGGRMKETAVETVTYNCPLLIKRGDYKNKDITQEMSLWLTD